MSRSMTKIVSTSAGTVRLLKSTHPTFVHACTDGDGFMTLCAQISAHEFDDPPQTALSDDVHVVMHVGKRDTPIRLYVPPKGGVLVERFPIFDGEEVWVSASVAKSIVLWGCIEW